MDPLNQDVLVLNSDYEPINICNLRRAIGMVCLGKVDVLESDSTMLHAPGASLISPSVVRLKYHIKRPMPRLRLSRRTIFARDNYVCQYCGQPSRELTVDHVIPKRLGGKAEWDNLVCCCRRCNSKKGDKSLQEVGFHLARTPRRPRWVPFVSLTKYMNGKRNTLWREYLPNMAQWDRS